MPREPASRSASGRKDRESGGTPQENSGIGRKFGSSTELENQTPFCSRFKNKIAPHHFSTGLKRFIKRSMACRKVREAIAILVWRSLH